jgi:hypothetical protein
MEGQQANKFLWNIHTAIEKSRIPGSDEDKRFLALALYGEAGEVANLIKKKWRGDKFPDTYYKALLREELGDVYAYLKLLAMAYSVTEPDSIPVDQLQPSNSSNDEVLYYSALSLCAKVGKIADRLLFDWATGHARYSIFLHDLILDSFYELFNLADKCGEDLNEILEREIIPKVRKRWGHLIES